MIHTEEYRIRTQEIDRHKKMTTAAMIQLMQETSMQQVIDLKASVWDLESRKISWVLLRKEMKLFKEAYLNDVITIKTYPTGFKKIFAYRDYKAYNQAGELLAQASSTWTLINTETRKTAIIPDDMFKFKADTGIGYLPEARRKLDPLENADYTNRYKINYLNLDWNGHVNNVFLVRCICESMPIEYLQRKMTEFAIHFKAESFLNDEISVQFSNIGQNKTAHQIIRTGDNTLIASANVLFEN